MENNNIKEQVAEGNGAQFPMPATPWKATNFWIFDNNQLPITTVDSVWFPSRTREATAKRIVECVNAMQGIDEPQKLRETWDAIQHLELDAYVSMKAQRDDLLYVLREVEKHHKSQNSEIGNKLRKVIEIVDLTKEIEEVGQP